MQMKGRAITPEEKRKVMDNIYEAWLRTPELRLGQLMECAKPTSLDDLFYIEDDKMVNYIQEFIDKHGK